MRQLTNLELSDVTGGNGESDQIDKDHIAGVALTMATLTMGGAIIGAFSNGITGAVVGGFLGGALMPVFIGTAVMYYIGIESLTARPPTQPSPVVA